MLSKTMTVKKLKKILSTLDDNVIVCLNINKENDSVYADLKEVNKEGLDFDEPCIILIGQEEE
jgi:hypothetical protein